MQRLITIFRKLPVTKVSIAICVLFISISRIYPLMKFGEAGLGYDTGFYRYYLEYKTDDFLKPPTFGFNRGSLGTRFILSTFSILNINANIVLFGSYIIFFLLLGWTIYLLAGQIFQDKKAAIFALVLFALSSVQWTAYTFMLYKNFWSLWILFLSFYLFENKNYFFGIPLLVALISHRTTAFVAMPSLFISAIIKIKNFKKSKRGVTLFLILLFFLGAILVITANWEFIVKIYRYLTTSSLQRNDIFNLENGIFMNIKQYLIMAFLYVVLGIGGFWLFLKNKRLKHIFSYFFLTAAALVILKSFFYRRVLIYLDLGFIVFSGGMLVYIYETLLPDIWGKLLTALIMLILSLNLIMTISNYKPMINTNEFKEIKSSQNILEKNTYVITFNSLYAPWLYGWLGTDKKIISPGLFYDKWNLEQWNEFWTANKEKQAQMLASYKIPLYIFNPQYDYADDKCFEKISELFWKFNCY